MQPHKHIRQLIDRFLEGTCTRAELKELFSLLQEEDHDDAVLHELDALWRKITGHDGGDTVDIEDRTDLLDAADTDVWFDEIFTEASTREGERRRGKDEKDFDSDLGEVGGADDVMSRKGGADDVMSRKGGTDDVMSRKGDADDVMSRKGGADDEKSMKSSADDVMSRKSGLNMLPRNKRKSSPFWKVAAILLFTLALSWTARDFYHVEPSSVAAEVIYTTKAADAGEKMRFMLPDGTQVHLNAESELRYPESFGDSTRLVHLSGEAFFVVARDEERPFVVDGGELSTQVLGTSFSFRAYPEDGEAIVAVTDGRVAVRGPREVVADPSETSGPDQLVLAAGQWAGYEITTRRFSRGDGDLSEFIDWNDGVLRYDNQRLEEVARQLERWYGVKITFTDEELGDCIIQGEHQNEILDNVLNSITYAFDMEYRIDGRRVVISGDGCRL